MTLDDKVDLILNKLNGSEGSELRTDIQTWLTPDHSNTVDNQLILDILLKEELIRPRGPALPDSFQINAKGRRINDKGGWNKYLKRKRRDQVIKKVITYANIGFAAINLLVLIYSANQNNRLDLEVGRLRQDLEKQHEIRNTNQRQIDSLKIILDRQGEKVLQLDSQQQVAGKKPRQN